MRLSELEEQRLEFFLNSRKVRAILRRGGSYAIVFGPNCGIGTSVTVRVISEDASVFLEKDITDYMSW